MDKENFIIIPRDIDTFLNPSDKDFLHRVYKNGLENYKERTSLVGFKSKEVILDAGCGFGQWALAMAQDSKSVIGIDISFSRIEICKRIANLNNFSNIEFLHGNIEMLPFNDNTFDAIFCYSAIYSTDYRKSFKEFSRVLKNHGLLYCCTNGWGWLIYNLIKNPNPSINFNPRKYAIETVINSLLLNITGYRFPNKDLVMNPRKIKLILQYLGFKKILLGPEGTLKHWDTKKNINPNLAFYPAKYFGLINVFEVLTEK